MSNINTIIKKINGTLLVQTPRFCLGIMTNRTVSGFERLEFARLICYRKKKIVKIKQKVIKNFSVAKFVMGLESTNIFFGC